MSDAKVEGAEKICGNCKEALICVKVVSTWNNKTEEKLQWQTKSTGKPHFKYAGPNNWKCILPTEQPAAEPAVEPSEAPKKTVKVEGPFDEAEIIARWAAEKAYKITMAEVTDINKLTADDKRGLGQKQGMLTRLLADTAVELMKIHGIKTNYGPKGKGTDGFD